MLFRSPKDKTTAEIDRVLEALEFFFNKEQAAEVLSIFNRHEWKPPPEPNNEPFILQYPDPKTAQREKEFAAAFLEEAGEDWQPRPGPVNLSISAVFKKPNSRPAKVSKEDWPTLHWVTKRPDGSNIVKLVEDGLKGVAWVDDAQVCRLMADKVYGEHPGTRVHLRFLVSPASAPALEPFLPPAHPAQSPLLPGLDNTPGRF